MTARSDTSRRAWFAAGLGLVALGALALRLDSFVGVVRPDSFRYAELSHHVLRGGSLFDEAVFFASSRLTLIGPLLGANALLGYGESASVAWPLFCSLGTVVLAGLLGAELFDRRVGLLAAFAVAIVPIELELATALLPDAVEGFFIVLAVYLGVLAVRRDRRGRVYAAASGVALGLAYFVRVNALVFLPGLLAVGTFVGRENWRRSLWSLLGLSAVLAAAAALFWLLSGDPLVDWHRSGSFFAEYAQGGFVERKHPFWWSFRYEQAFKLWFYPALAVGMLAALIRREGSRWLLLAWVLGFWFYLDAISPLHGLDSVYRYAEPLVVPLAILASAAVFDIKARLSAPAGRALIAVTVVALALVLVPVSRELATRYARNGRWLAVRALAERVTDSPDPVWVDDPWVLLSLNYYSGFTLERDTLEPPDAPVNATARLFTVDERALPATGAARAVLLEKPDGSGWIAVDEQPYQKLTLVLYERPR